MTRDEMRRTALPGESGGTPTDPSDSAAYEFAWKAFVEEKTIVRTVLHPLASGGHLKLSEAANGGVSLFNDLLVGHQGCCLL